MVTARKFVRWNGNSVQQWLDLEAKLMGQGKLSKKPPKLNTENFYKTNMGACLKRLTKVTLLDDTEWAEWESQWIDGYRPCTRDPRIWGRAEKVAIGLVIGSTRNSRGDEEIIRWNTEKRRVVWYIQKVVFTENGILLTVGSETVRLEVLAQQIWKWGRRTILFNTKEPGVVEFLKRVKRQYYVKLNVHEYCSYGGLDATTDKGVGSCYDTTVSYSPGPNTPPGEWKKIVAAKKLANAMARFGGRKTK